MLHRYQYVTVATLFALLIAAAPTWAGNNDFRRGDYDNSGGVQLPDVVQLLNHLFLGSPEPECMDAADFDDSGGLNVADAVILLQYLFAGGSAPPSPGPDLCGPDPTPDALDCDVYNCSSVDLVSVGHLLNRIAYGPSPADVQLVDSLGITAFVQQQLDPGSIDEASNTELNSRLDPLFDQQVLKSEEILVPRGEFWRYRKGDSAPPANWADSGFDDSSWLLGQSGIGYGDGDDTTELTDMRHNYTSIYMRQSFPNPGAITDLVLRIDYDDSYVAYLNGVEVARSSNITGMPPAFDVEADSSHEAGDPEDVLLDQSLLLPGTNVLAIQGHNVDISSNDFSLIPELIAQADLPVAPRTVIKGIDELQELLHVRGVYARRQLQAVLGEFWENHFTTDYDKTREALEDAVNSDGSIAMSEGQARFEAAQLEQLEYEFFHENALGNFGDLLRFSATSPAMLIYLDSILNLKADANENYAREILELHTMGVDNGYTQGDIEQLALCFTGWNLTKVPAYTSLPFPDSVTNPPITPGYQLSDVSFIDIGDTWRYLKGTAEPTPDPGGDPTTAWAEIGYDDTTWLSGQTGIGYGDGDDTTVITDMESNYATIYLRKAFTIADPSTVESLVLDMDYDDGFVAYLNGIEVARSDSLEDRGDPPAFDRTSRGHEAGTAETYNLSPFRIFLQAGTNILALQVHNSSVDSNDLSILPRLVQRTLLPGTVDTGDRSGEWVFRFDPDQHNIEAKTLFENSPFQVDIPAGRVGVDGVLDALDVIDALVSHPSTAEFICLKLVQKFVSDEITLVTLNDQTAPVALRNLVASAIAAWYSTTPPGDIENVVTTILDPTQQQSHFWAPVNYRGKIKTPIEFVNSSLRALDASANGNRLPRAIDRMGMDMFTRNNPDGWPEAGLDWLDTGTMLERLEFVKELSQNDNNNFTWDVAGYLSTFGVQTAAEIIDHFDSLLFQGTLSQVTKDLLLEFVETDDAGQPLPLDPAGGDYIERVQGLVGLILSAPLWHAQ